MAALLAYGSNICFSAERLGSNLIQRDRIGYLKIGNPVPKLNKDRIRYDELVEGENGGRSRVLGVIVQGQIVKIELDKNIIWRMSVSSPGIKSVEGVEVGTPVALLASRSHLNIEIGAGGELILLPINQCGLVYWSNLQLDSSALLKQNWDRNFLVALPENITVQSILVTGICSKVRSK